MKIINTLFDLKEKAQSTAELYWDVVPSNIKETLKLNLFAIMKIPMIAFLSPKVTILNTNESQIIIPLGKRSKNHWNSMYFGALAVGADLAVGILAMKLIEESGQKLSLIFKDFSAEFLKRAHSDVVFKCLEGDKIRELVTRAIETGNRENQTIEAIATSNNSGDEVEVAKFKLTLSLKLKS